VRLAGGGSARRGIPAIPVGRKCCSPRDGDVESLLQGGQEREALNRALTLRGKYGPDSAWAQSQPASVREKTAKDLTGMYRTLAGKTFDQGIRSGERSALSSSAALMAEYFQMKGDDTSGEDGNFA